MAWLWTAGWSGRQAGQDLALGSGEEDLDLFLECGAIGLQCAVSIQVASESPCSLLGIRWWRQASAPAAQVPIQPGDTYSYEHTVGQWGTFFYHSHDHADRQQTLGLYGALLIDPADPADQVPADYDYAIQLGEWLNREGLTFPSMPMEGGLANYFTINGKAYPETETITMNVGETLRVRFIGSNSVDIHPMHIHGGPFAVVARDSPSWPRRSDSPPTQSMWGRSALRRDRGGAAARQMAHPLPHQPPHDEQQRRNGWGRRADHDHRCR